MGETKRCPYCAEEILAEAIRCRYCRSRLVFFDADAWHRSHPEARLAGVCACMAHTFSVPVAAVRLGFVIFTLFFTSLRFYLAMWLILPEKLGGESLLEQTLRWALDFVGGSRSRHNDTSLPRPPVE